MKHIKTYRALPVGGQAICSCGFESPVVDESAAFSLGLKVKSVDEYFREHLAQVETTMGTPVAEQAVAPAQRAGARKKRSTKR
jgi:hypothetical protein